MRLVNQADWGVILEHDGHLMLLPYRSRFPFPVQTKVVINENNPDPKIPDLTVIVSSNDFACYVEQSVGPVHIILKDSHYAQMIEKYMNTIMTRNPQ